MSARAHDVELLLLTMFAAVPLYATQAVGVPAVVLFHAALAVMTFRVARGGVAQLLPPKFMRALAIAYVPFYLIDMVVISRSAIAASTHLVLFIAVYQPAEAAQKENRAQRLLTAGLIFVASLATSTHITIVLFVIAFAFVMFRQVMYLSHLETERSVGRSYLEMPSSRAAVFYLSGTMILAALLFPVIPRIRNPMVHGVANKLTNASTGLSNSIDFNRDRSSTPDPSIVARVWMGQEAIPFFTPLRLRGTVYDRYSRNRWMQTHRGYRIAESRRGVYRIARPVGFTRGARVQQRLSQRNPRVFVPVGTYAVSGIGLLAEGPGRGAYASSTSGRDLLTYDVSMARRLLPLRPETPKVVDYPVIPAVAALARQMVGQETRPAEQAAAVEQYMLDHFTYVANPEQIGRRMTTDEFLLKDRRGHCEYFAAGMVALMAALHVPSRIVGGYYGGRLNPLTGYFVVRNEDAHAWVEVWDGQQWLTYDPTPPSLRPGNTQGGLLSTYASAIGDSVNYFWDRYVLTYGLGDQIAFAVELIGRAKATLAAAATQARDTLQRLGQIVHGDEKRDRLLFAFGVAAAALLAFAAAAVIAIRRRRRPIFHTLAEHLAARGIIVGPAMTIEEALEILRREQPQAAEALAPVITMYEEEQFSPRRDRARVAMIRRRLADLRA